MPKKRPEIGGQLGLPPALFFPESRNQNFEIAILFNIVDKSNNYVCEDDLIPHFPGEWLQVKKFTLCLRIVLNLEVYRYFQEGFFLVGMIERRGLCRRIFPWREFSLGKRIFMKGS